MVEYIPPPEPRQLLAPLLACLPLGFAASRPPPVLLPLLSPVLRQRVQLLGGAGAGSGSASSADSWLRLLCWGPANAAEVERIVGEAESSFEPHPVSGEIEIPDDITIAYRWFDAETLRCQLPLDEFGLTVVYVWCPTDQEGGGAGWRVAEVLPLDALRDDEGAWFGSVEQANEALRELAAKEGSKETAQSSKASIPFIVHEEDNGDEDDYWAQYDTVQSRTPANGAVSIGQDQHDSSHRGEQMSDTAYYNQYSNVQPALDSDDPTVDKADVGDSSLNGNTLEEIFKRQMGSILQQQQLQSQSQSAAPERGRQPAEEPDLPLSHPRPASASSSNRSDAISKLEYSAECQSASEMAIRQHISTNVKSMFRLARAAGISRAEYQAMITRELDLLEMMENDD
ncbi:hypothetical protein MGYG_05081 [Nannizzia gypsea CBS 118893]|uniref:Uncharacterized protein n=1 Tax=Arthroderma gypseum (strain ATCC MYA-4604 / CBS 118893) TaxID=535722 RepID=E4UYB5_ARTGP|nr:hypothetical protein MGYG_05081 [Nannizzia gypsea CBS 118893]EFR02078.1 hypothetical protein MGYG_05081 [Nannizzia gypsea CBS 118893]